MGGTMRVYLLLLVVFVPDFSAVVHYQGMRVDEELTGNDIEQIYSPDPYHCQLACTQHHSCRFFTFLRADWGNDDRKFHCYLKNTESGFPFKVNRVKGMTSGFPLTRRDLETQDCLSSLYQDVEFTGSDYRVDLSSSSSDQCQEICTNDPDCKFFSFFTERCEDAEKRKKCYLKFSWTVPSPQKVIHKPDVISGFSQSLFKAKNTSEEECTVKTQHNYGSVFNNDALEELPAVSFEHCKFLCKIHPLCNYFSYSNFMEDSDLSIFRRFIDDDENEDLNWQCYLYARRPSPRRIFFNRRRVDLSYAKIDRNCQLSNDWATKQYTKVDFNLYEYHYTTVDDDESCRHMCTSDPDCHFYTYIISPSSYFSEVNWRMCYLKKVMTLPRPKVVSMRGVISGFSQRSCKTSNDTTQEKPIAGFEQKHCGKKMEIKAKIYMGSDASAGEWPWQVSLQKAKAHSCGASILSNRWVITAAHCLDPPHKDISIRTGLTKLLEGGTEYMLEKIVIHPHYDKTTYENDIGLLKIKTPIIFNDITSPVCLIRAENEAGYFGKRCTVTGWGRTETGSHPDTLQVAQVPLIGPDDCTKQLPFAHIFTSKVCAGYPEGGIDTCSGDSGGPLVCEGESSWSLTGLTSSGYGCGIPGKPGMYTRVSHYLQWIKHTVQNE